MAKKLSQAKAIEMLKNPPHGMALTDKQQQYFTDVATAQPPPLTKMGGWLDKYNDGGPVQPNYNDAQASTGPDYVGTGYDTTGRNYSPAWGGQFAMGGSVPGAVGFTYARVAGAAPRNGKYTKKTKASAQNGKEMQFYQNGLDWKPNNISRDGSVIKDDMGYWNPENHGKVVEIDSPYITMEGVDQPLLGVSDTGDTQLMQPGENYKFKGNKVTEYPQAQNGWLGKYDNTSDATSIAPKVILPISKDEINKNIEENKKRTQEYNDKVITERKKARDTKGSVAEHNFTTGEKFRMFPNSVGGVGELFDDYVNPAKIIGDRASDLGNSRTPLEALGSVATTAGFGALGLDPLGSAMKAAPFVERLGTDALTIGKDISKAKNIKEAIGRFAGVPVEKTLARMPIEDVKALRQVQEVGRLRATNTPITDQMKYALDNKLPEEHFQQVFHISREEAEQQLSNRVGENESARSAGIRSRVNQSSDRDDIRNMVIDHLQNNNDLLDVNNSAIQNIISPHAINEDGSINYDRVSNTQLARLRDHIEELQYSESDRLHSSDYNEGYDPSDDNFSFDRNRPINGHAPGTPEWNALNEEVEALRANAYNRDPSEYVPGSYRGPDAFEPNLDAYNEYQNINRPNVNRSSRITDILNNANRLTQQTFAPLREGFENYAEQKIPTSTRIKNFKENFTNNLIQSYPYHGGEVLQKVPSLFLDDSGLKSVSKKVGFAPEGINSGDVFTGSTNTSHNSWLPQIKQVFKYDKGTPQFLGYKPMNHMGFLSNFGYEPNQIVSYLNSELDEQIKRKVLPNNIQRPYIKDERVILPQYGVKQKKNGGWLDKYAEGGIINNDIINDNGIINNIDTHINTGGYTTPSEDINDINMKVRTLGVSSNTPTPNKQVQTNKELRFEDIPTKDKKKIIIDNFSPKFDYIVEGDKTYYKTKGGDTWADISNNKGARNNLLKFIDKNNYWAGYSSGEKEELHPIAQPTKSTPAPVSSSPTYKPSDILTTDLSFPGQKKPSEVTPVLAIQPVHKTIKEDPGFFTKMKDAVTSASNETGKTFDNFGKHVDDTVNDIKKSIESGANIAIQTAEDSYHTLVNGVKRKFATHTGNDDDAAISTTKTDIPKTVKEWYGNKTGPEISAVVDDPNHEGRQFKQQVLPTSNIKFGVRNRGEYKNIQTDGLEVTTFNPFTKDKLPDNTSVLALDPGGNLHTGAYKDFKNEKGFTFSKTFKNNIVDFSENNGKAEYIDGAKSGNPKYKQPKIKVLNDDGKLVDGSLNVLVKDDSKKNYYGSIQGGRVLFVNPTTKEQYLVSGSVDHIKEKFKELKGNNKYLEAYTLDNGTYSRGLSYKDKNLTPERLKSYDLENTGGGNGLYIMDYKQPVNKYKEEYIENMPNIRTVNDDTYKKGHALKNEVKNIVLHHTAYTNPNTSEEEVKKQYMTKDNNSSHVVIQENGKRTVYASPEQVTRHAGESEWKGRKNVNDFGVGVEFQGDTNKKPLTSQQIESFIEYYTPIAKKYNLALNDIITHQMVAPGRKPDIAEKEYSRILSYMKNKGYK